MLDDTPSSTQEKERKKKGKIGAGGRKEDPPGGQKKEKEGKKKDPPGSYQRLDLFIKVLWVLCPNLTDVSFSLSRLQTISSSMFTSLLFL